MQHQSFRNPSGIAALAAAPWLAVTAFAAYRAWVHWQTMFPFGAKGHCGGPVPHCAWCTVSVLGLVLAATTYVLARSRRARAVATR